ncbi:MAG: hypothetical protein JWR51_2407 [Devosia sp.]|uniref:PopZ family protein n=1 Tax=Devosia sp. TaxID=1871048 RepID=UPI0026380705|nr:DUF2497 domain-containing protein [Devosia sp.]MDB5529304.1 hypothetical protein [Devosia sp.]
MAQPNVAREPSMEEILASIRKIIESNEPGAGKSISASLPPVYELSDEEIEDIRLTIDDDLAAAELNDIPPSPAAVPDARFVAANSAGQQRDAAPEPRTLSLADVAARVRAASERNSAQLNPAREAPPQRELPPAMAARLAEVRFTHEEPERPEPVAEAPTAQPMTAPEVVAVEAHAETDVPEVHAQDVHIEVPQVVVQIRPVEQTPQSVPRQQAPTNPFAGFSDPSPAPAYVRAAPTPSFAEAPQPQPLPIPPEQETRFLPQVQEEVQKMLVSEATGEQVARSFDELAAALGQERRSLDEVAQDMLRPMLQEWLDDNLPTLVERLVREEIERVARGPRR